MAEIPNDVMKSAIAARQDGFNNDGWHLEEPHIRAIAKAILAERKRCAKIVDSHPDAHYSAVRDAIMSGGEA